MRFRKLLAIMSATALLGACTKPIPQEKSAYVGEWHGAATAMLITQDGRVVYKHQDGNATTSINAPLKEFKGDDFVVGIGPLSTTFKVSKPPHRDGTAWKMTVDGAELTKQ